MKKSLLILALFVTSFCQAQEWKLIYHNDADGKAISGQIADLIQAVRDGKEIRMAWGGQSPNDPKRKVEHLANAAFLTIMSDSIVFGQIAPIYGQTPDFNEFSITLKENLQWVMIGGTNGKSDASMTNQKTGGVVGHNARERWFKWYVKD